MSSETLRELSLLLRSGHRLIAVETFEEDRALRLLERVAGSAERKLRRWSVATGLDGELIADGAGPGQGSLEAGLEAVLELSEPSLVVLLDAHELLADAGVRRRLRDVLGELGRRRQTLVFVGAVVDLPVELEREAGRVVLPLPTPAELSGLFERVGSGSEAMAPEALETCVRSALGLTGAEAVRVFRKAWLASEGDATETAAQIVREKERALRRTPALEFHAAETGLEQVGGLSELKRWLRERRRAFGADAQRFGLPAPRGLLLLGVQGCGKSLCAKAVAREWRFPLLRLDLAAAFGDPERSPELTLREATAVAESIAPAVLWIDEIEKGFAAVNAEAGASRTFGSFLTWLAEERAPVFVVATANDVTALPPELLRRGRFDELFFVDLPDPREREEILRVHLRARGRDPDQFPLADLALAAERHSGAEIEQVVAAALWTAFAESRELTEQDLFAAIQDTVPLYETYEERIKELRDWARTRARPASMDVRMGDLFTP
ncbi:MAG: AAA family ATPase [Myxococcota bacterium]|nr:AAA family ATPase [Myxococcota bacterium]